MTVSLLVLVLSNGPTYLVWRSVHRAEREALDDAFNYLVRDAHQRITHGLAALDLALHGAAGLFSASGQVDAQAWRAYVASLDLDRLAPGTQALGFAPWVPAPQKAAWEAALGRQGLALHPAGTRPGYAPVTLLEPAEGRNHAALGFDTWSDPVRREALAQARDGNCLRLSGKVTLAQEQDGDAPAGFLLVLPVYRGPAPPDVEGRRMALAGWVNAPLRMDDFMRGLLGEREADLCVAIRDGDDTGAMMYQNGTRSLSPPAHFKVEPLAFAGHQWSVAIGTRPSFLLHYGHGRTSMVVWQGLLRSLLLAVIAYNLVRRRDRFLLDAQEATRIRRDLELQEARHQASLGLLAGGMAHDYNNLLQALAASAYLARTAQQRGESAAPFFDLLDEAYLRIKELSNRLTLLDPNFTSKRTLGDLRPLLQACVTRELAGSACTLLMDLPEPVVVPFNTDHLETVFTNLARNAVEAMDGPGTLAVSARMVADGPPPLQPGSCWCLEFMDSGRGIPPEALPTVFEPYASSKTRDSTKGQGLGLALCRAILKLHGGAITAASQGRGATFRLYLPTA